MRKLNLTILFEIALFYIIVTYLSMSHIRIVQAENIFHTNYFVVIAVIYIITTIIAIIRLYYVSPKNIILTMTLYGAIVGQYFVWLFTDDINQLKNILILFESVSFWAIVVGLVSRYLAKVVINILNLRQKKR